MSVAEELAGSRLDTSGLFGEWRRRQPTLAAGVLVIVVAMVPTLIAMAIDVRTFNGVSVWLKPFKFQLSAALQMGTVVWFWAYLDGSIRAQRSVRIMVWMIGLITLSEVSYITFRGSLAEGSHFNQSTPMAGLAHWLMGIGILTAFGMSAWIGVLILRSTEGGISPALRLAIGLGLITGTILGVATGLYMSAHGSHWVRGVATDAGGLPLFGWSRTGGDLRVAHFVGLHAMQGIPIVGYFVRNMPAGRIIVWASLAIWTAVAAFVFIQAVSGRPFLPF